MIKINKKIQILIIIIFILINLALITQRRNFQFSNIRFNNYQDSISTYILSLYNLEKKSEKFNINDEELIKIANTITANKILKFNVSDKIKKKNYFRDLLMIVYPSKYDPSSEVTIDICEYKKSLEVYLKICS
jgi:hypothetical protein